MNASEIDTLIKGLYKDIRGAVANVLRKSRYYGQDDIDDVTQDACLYLARVTIPAWDPAKANGNDIRWWILRQAHNITINYLKSHCRSKIHASISATDADYDVSGGITLAGANEHARHLDAMTIRAAVALLDAIDAQFVMAYLQTDSVQLAGEAVGDTLVQASRRKARVWAEMAELLS